MSNGWTKQIDVNYQELQNLVKRSKNIYIYAPALETSVKVYKRNVLEIVKNQMQNYIAQNIPEDTKIANVVFDEYPDGNDLWIDNVIN